jgi:GR25 family glycosyltransferase involved in LPS biosynthesis
MQFAGQFSLYRGEPDLWTNIRALIIHLERADQRRRQVDQIRALLPVPSMILPALDGRHLSGEFYRMYRRDMHKPKYPFKLTVNELACFLSHRKAWKAIVDENLDAGLVLEDDADLGKDFRASLEFVLEHLKPGDFVRFPDKKTRESGVTAIRTKGIKLIVPSPVGLRTVAQLVTRDAAIQLLKVTEQFDRPVDVFLQLTWLASVQVKSVVPSGVTEISECLGGSTLALKKSTYEKLQRETLRPLYRAKIGLLSRWHSLKPAKPTGLEALLLYLPLWGYVRSLDWSLEMLQSSF